MTSSTPIATKMGPSVLSAFALDASKIGGSEIYCRELSAQLGNLECGSILCFEREPPAFVREYLELPNVILEQIPDLNTNRLGPMRRLAQVIRKHKPDIVHLHYTGFVTLYPWIARAYGAKQVYLTNHYSPPESCEPHPAALWKRLAARLINRPVSGVVCPSDYGRQWLSARGLLPGDKFRTIYNATELSVEESSTDRADRFRRKFQIPADRQIITQVGMLISEKGVFDLLAAAARVVSKHPKAHFVLVGDGCLAQACRDRAEALNLQEHVTFTGQIEDIMSSGLYDATDICCLVSRWEELFGFVLVEAMTFGLPIIATRVGGIPEVVADSQTGYLVERGNVEAITERIGCLLRDSDLRKTLGDAGQRRVAKLFNVRQNVAELIDWYGVAPQQAE